MMRSMDITRYETYPVHMFETPAYKVPTTAKNDPNLVFTEAEMQAAYQEYCLMTSALKDLGFADLITVKQENNNRTITSHLSPMDSFYSVYAKYHDELSRGRGEAVGFNRYSEAVVTLFHFHTQTAIVESLPTRKFPFLTPLLPDSGVSPLPGANNYTVEGFCDLLSRLKESLEEELTLHGVACSSEAVNTLLTLKAANCRSLLVRGDASNISRGSEKYPCGGMTPLDSFPGWFELIADNAKAENILLLTSHVMNPDYARTKKLSISFKEISELGGIPIEWIVKMFSL